jgi:hypothetical protein
MRGKVLGIIGATALLMAVSGGSASAAGIGDCHADGVQFYKQLAGTHSGEGTADALGVTIQFGQEFISQSCGQS